MDILAASGVQDFVFEGEKKLPLDEYRYLLRSAMELARIHLVGTEENAPGMEMLEAWVHIAKIFVSSGRNHEATT